MARLVSRATCHRPKAGLIFLTGIAVGFDIYG